MYGPYLPLAAGSYVVRIFGQWLDGNAGNGARVDVTADGGNRKLAEATLVAQTPSSNVGSLIEFPLTLVNAEPAVEVRVMVDDGTRLAIGRYEIVAKP